MPHRNPAEPAWTPALAARLEPPVLDLEDDYETRLQMAPSRFRLVLGLGGLPIEIRTDSEGVHGYLLETMGTFVEASEPVVRLAVAEVEGEFPFRTLIGTLMTYARGSHVIGKFRQMAGYIDTQARSGCGVITRGNYRQDLVNYLRLVVDAMMPPLDAVLFHTAGVARNGHAYLFYGHSTAGKSTITHLAARRHEIITDDMLVLRLERGRLQAASCGFWGGGTNQYPSKRIDLPVKGFFRLKKGPINRLDPVGEVRGALDLVCGIPSLTRPKSDHRFMLEFAAAAASRVPFHELTFQKNDDSFWSVIDEHE